MTHEQIQERFRALLQLVESVHAKCKSGPDSIESLVDQFYQCHHLMQSFMTDCSELLPDVPPTPQLQATVHTITHALHCSIAHVVESQERFGTKVITDIIMQFHAAAHTPDNRDRMN